MSKHILIIAAGASSTVLLYTTLLVTQYQSASAASDSWRINPKNSSIEFAVKNMGLGVEGKFATVSGDVTYDEKHLELATVEASIDAASINTGLSLRDHHLKGKDFFNVAKFPRLEFRSDKVEAEPDGDFIIRGSLCMHGVSEEITLHAKPLSQPVQGADGKKHISTSAAAQLNRKDFAIGGFTAASISNQVNIELKIDLVK